MNKRNVIITIVSVLMITCLFAFARTTTTDLGLVKPTWTETLDILTDINANSDILEAFANDPLEFDSDLERLEDRAGAMWTGNTETGLTVTYQDADNTIDVVIGANDIVQSMLKCVNEPNDEEIFTYESTTGDFEWHTLAELSIQPLDTALTNISALAYVSPSFIKLTADDTYAVRTLAQTLTDIGGAASGVNADITSMTGLDDNGIPLAKVANAASDGANTDITSLTGVNLIDVDTLNFADAAELTMDTDGEVTATQSYHRIDTFEDAATDDLVVINGGTAGDIIYICAANDARTVVLKHDDTAGAGKIITSEGTDYSLDDNNKVISLIYDSADSHWHMASGGGGGSGEANTASNVGSEVEIYKQKTGVDLEFRTLKANSNQIEVTNAPTPTIDIGEAAIDRTSAEGIRTMINKGNPSDGVGIINNVEIWANTELSGVKVATFFVVSGNNLSTRDYESIGTVTAGSKQSFAVNLDVEVGDYLGIYFSGGTIEYHLSGYSDTWNSGYDVDRIPCTNTAFDVFADDAISLYGTGITSYLDYIKFDVNEGNIRLDDLKATEDNTDLDASTTAHGLMPKLPFSGDLLSTTTVAFNADADTTLYTVPAGKRCVLSHAMIVAAADAGATTTISMGAADSETDFIPNNTLSNLDAQYDVVIVRPIPNTTPLKNKSYAAATVIEARVASQSGAAGNTIYLFGIIY